MLPLCRDRDPTSVFTVAVLIPAARQTHTLNFQHNPPYPHRLLQSSVSVLLLHCAPTVRAHPQGQLQGTGCLASRWCTVLARHPSIRRCGTIFTLTSAQEAAIASRVGSSLVQAKRERCLVSAMMGIKREKHQIRCMHLNTSYKYHTEIYFNILCFHNCKRLLLNRN